MPQWIRPQVRPAATGVVRSRASCGSARRYRRHGQELRQIEVAEKRRERLTEQEAPRDVADLSRRVAGFARELRVAAQRVADSLERAPRTLGDIVPPSHPLRERLEECQRRRKGFPGGLRRRDPPVEGPELSPHAVRLHAEKPALIGREHHIHAPALGELTNVMLDLEAVTLLDEEVQPAQERPHVRGRYAVLEDGYR